MIDIRLLTTVVMVMKVFLGARSGDMEDIEYCKLKLLLTGQNIMKTSPCNEDPHTPHFYIVKLGFTGVYIFFLFLLQNIDCGYSLEPPR